MLLEEPIHSHYCNLNLNLSARVGGVFPGVRGCTKERKLEIKIQPKKCPEKSTWKV